MSQKQVIRAVQIGCGNLGRHTVRYMYENGIQVVGAVDCNPNILGKDIGELAGLAVKTGVCVQESCAQVVEHAAPDVAVITMLPTMEAVFPYVMECVSRGIHVVTSCEDFAYPWDFTIEQANKIHAMAKKMGVCVLGSGTQELFCNLAMGLARSTQRIDRIQCTLCDDTELYSAKAVEPFGVGLTREAFEDAFGSVSQAFIPSYLWGTARLMAACMGWTVKSISQTDAPAIMEETMMSQSLGREIPAGQVAGMETTIKLESYQGPTLEIVSVCRAYARGDSRADHHFWKFFGEPNMELTMSKLDTFPITAAAIAKRVFDVFHAPKGLITLDQLRQ